MGRTCLFLMRNSLDTFFCAVPWVVSGHTEPTLLLWSCNLPLQFFYLVYQPLTEYLRSDRMFSEDLCRDPSYCVFVQASEPTYYLKIIRKQPLCYRDLEMFLLAC